MMLYTFVLVITFFLTAYLLSRFDDQTASSDELISPIFTETKNSQDVQSLSTTEFAKAMQKAVADALDGTRATYSVVIRDLTTDETYSLNADREYTTASLYKLWTMAVVYERIENGRSDKDQILSATIPELNEAFNIASDSAEKVEGEISLSVEDALERMITVSENYPAMLLTRHVGVSNVASFLKKEGFTQSTVGRDLPKSTASDIAAFYTKLYRSDFVSNEYTQEMLELLKRQRINDRIPKYLPESIEVAHKTGELGSSKHDAGIVFTPEGDYVIVMMSESSTPQQAAERLAKISENVYNTFTQK